jgi:hypothetical protein
MKSSGHGHAISVQMTWPLGSHVHVLHPSGAGNDAPGACATPSPATHAQPFGSLHAETQTGPAIPSMHWYPGGQETLLQSSGSPGSHPE